MTFEQYCNYMTAYNFKVVYYPSAGSSRGEIGNVYVTTMTDKKLFRFDCASNEYTGIRLYGEVQYINFSTLCLILDLTNISYSVGMRLEDVTGNLSPTVNNGMTAGGWINSGQKGHSSISIKITQAGIFRFGFSGLNDNNTDKWSSFGWSNYMLNKGTKELPYTPYP